MALHCGVQMLKCGMDTVCRNGMACFAKCNNDTSCDFGCEQSAYGNEPMHHFMQCSADNHCLPTHEPDCFPAAKCRRQTCNATNDEAVANLTSLAQLSGEWWTVNGVNQHYDYYPCQHEHVLFNGTNWVNNATYGIDSKKQRLYSVMALSMPAPGVVRHDYTDTALRPNVETWRFVSFPHPEWAFVLWCGDNPVGYYSGGFVLSRQQDITAMPEAARAAMRSDLLNFGLDLDQLRTMDNSQCGVEAKVHEVVV
jgi:hypothetical protein